MFSEKDFIPKSYSNKLEKGSFTWSAPSNIALVKYWGKIENKPSEIKGLQEQIPANPSVSFTLKNCKTITHLSFEKKEVGDFSFDLFFEDKPKEDFKPKIKKFLERIAIYCRI